MANNYISFKKITLTSGQTIADWFANFYDPSIANFIRFTFYDVNGNIVGEYINDKPVSTELTKEMVEEVLTGTITSHTHTTSQITDATTLGKNLVKLTNGSTVSFPRFNADNTVSKLDAAAFRAAIGAGTSSTTGTVTSVGLTVPTGLSVSGSPIETSGALGISFASGYSIPTIAKQNNWDIAYGWGNHASAGYITSNGISGMTSGQVAIAGSGSTITGSRAIDATSGGTSGSTSLITSGAVFAGLTTKQPIITGAASTITTNNLTANRALVSNASGKVATSSVTSTELSYLSGATSAIQNQLNTKIVYDDVIMPGNGAGGKKLYINSINNAFYAMDKRAVVEATIHPVSHNGNTYPMLNPNYVEVYTVTGSGTTRQITNTPYPSNIVVFENDVLKLSPTHYSYNTTTGLITFVNAPSGTIHVYPGAEIPQYLDSPVSSNLSPYVSPLFDGGYESGLQVEYGYYLKIKITPDGTNYSRFSDFFGTYTYGDLYASYYYSSSPQDTFYRVYNYSYRGHTPGWKLFTMSDYVGAKGASQYIATASDHANHGRTIMEFIVVGRDISAGGSKTRIVELDLKPTRGDLSKIGSAVTKFSDNKLYYKLNFGTRTSNNVEIDPEGSITAINFLGTLTGNATTATTATKLATARTIGGVSFDGTANIDLPGVNTTGNQNTTGSAATLTTPRTLTIGNTGKTFNGGTNVSWTLTEIGAAPTSHTHTYTDLTGTVPTWNQNTTGSAATLTTPRTIALGAGVVGTPTAFNGSSNITIPVTGISEAYLTWGGKNFSSAFGPIDAAMVGELGANRFAFYPENKILVEYSLDAGSTWLDYEATQTEKINLFNGVGTALRIGKNTSTGINYTNYRLRVTLKNTQGSLYTALNKFVILASTNGSGGTWATIEGRLQSDVEANNDTWNVFSNQTPISGWSGYNVINTADFTTFGNSNNKSGQYGEVRFIFGGTTANTSFSGLQILKILGFGGVGWTTPSNLAKSGNIYTYNYLQETTFPAKVVAPTFVGALTGNATTATTLQTPRTLTIGSTGKTFNGGANVTWTLAEIGAQAIANIRTTWETNPTDTTYPSAKLVKNTIDNLVIGTVTVVDGGTI